MNRTEFEQARRKLYEEMDSHGYGWVNGKWKTTEEYALRDRELSCIDMINSILAYNCCGYKEAEKVLVHEENSYHNYLADYVKELGRDKVLTLIQGQIDSIAYVQHCVQIDSEGVSYNSIVWK